MTPAEKRQQITQILNLAFAPIPVFASPPSSPSVPCVLVTMGQATAQPKRLSWEVEYHATLIGPGGDNEAAVQWVETMIVEAARQVSETLITQVTWDRPGQITLAGTTYHAATLTFGTDIEPGPDPVGGM